MLAGLPTRPTQFLLEPFSFHLDLTISPSPLLPSCSLPLARSLARYHHLLPSAWVRTAVDTLMSKVQWARPFVGMHFRNQAQGKPSSECIEWVSWHLKHSNFSTRVQRVMSNVTCTMDPSAIADAWRLHGIPHNFYSVDGRHRPEHTSTAFAVSTLLISLAPSPPVSSLTGLYGLWFLVLYVVVFIPVSAVALGHYQHVYHNALLTIR